MDSGVLGWLDSVGSWTFYASAILFVLVNGAAAVAFALRRDRQLVNRWTPRVLAIDLVLIGVGAGGPALAAAAKLAIRAGATLMGTPASPP